MKVVINKCYGGFGISKECLKLYNELTEKNVKYDWDIERSDPFLIQAIEKIGEKESSDSLAELKIIEIPDGTKYTIEEYDGIEWIAEEHNTWS